MAPRTVAILLFLALGAFAADVQVADSKNRPVTKVINLLKDMLKQLEKEGEEDEDIYEKMGCWCVTYEKEKTKSIADGQSRITELTSSIEALSGDFARLTAEIENLEREVAKNTDALESATALRAKQLAEFNQEEKDTLLSINGLKSAIITMSQVHGGASFLQLTNKQRTDVATTVGHILRKHSAVFAESLTPKQRRMLKSFVSFVQAPEHFNDGPTMGDQSYAPQSGAIFGVLKQMKEDFETSLAKSSKEEEQNVAAYEDLKAAKQAEIKAGKDQIETKSGEAANAGEKKASDKEDLTDTRATLAEDQKFLSDLQLKCQDMDSQFEERTKTRQMEIAATSKALEFLSSDEAHDLFTRTFNPSLLQSGSRARRETNRRVALAKMLDDAAKKANDPRLSALAVKARLDAFEEVKNTIKMMIDKLLKEKDDDIKHKDYCIDSFNENDNDTADKYKVRDQVLAAIEDHQATVDQLDAAIETLKAEIQEIQVAQKRASAQREKANTEFQATVADQRATQKLLTAALKVLQGFYGKAALVQMHVRSATGVSKQPPPPGFKNYENNAASGGVMGMMQKIIDDAKAMESEALRSEEEEQAAFEEFTKDSTASIDQKSKDVVNKSAQKAQTEKDKIAAEVTRDQTLSEIEELEQVNADLHKSCDFLMKNFDLRVTSRDAEMEALKQGLALFSGASFGAFLQHQ